jgi:hypothetical protein
MATLADPALDWQARAYLRLRPHWRRDPVRYVEQRFGISPTWQQRQILEAIAPPGAKVSVRSGHGVGKSSCAAFIVLWHLETHDYSKVPCTAPSSHQLRDVLWAEIAKWRRHADAQSAQRGDHPALSLSALFHLTQDRLVDVGAPDWGAFGRTARKESGESLQGFHGTHLLYVIDEASGVEEPIFEAAEGALSTPGARVLMLGNPLRNTGTFAASHKYNRGDYTALHYRSQDSPLVDPGYRDRLVRKWGEGSNIVRVRADGLFPRQESDVLISLELTEPCLVREPVPAVGKRRLGVDPARYGDDRTVLLLRHGAVVEAIAIYAKQDTMATCGHVVEKAKAWRADEIYVDTIGLGSGVYDRLGELRREGQLRCELIAVNAAEAAPQKHANDDAQGRRLRDWLWLAMAKWLQNDSPVFAAEDRQACEDLCGELSSTKLTIDSSGLVVVESKDEMRQRLGHSPDLADALGCTFAPSAPTLPAVDMRFALEGMRKPAPPGVRMAPARPHLGSRRWDEDED